MYIALFSALSVGAIALALNAFRWSCYLAPIRKHEATKPLKELPPVSIIIPTHEQGRVLEENIESFLAQKYPKFEIIIVDCASTDCTADVIKRLDTRLDKRIRHTFVPSTARYVGRRKLAITLGIRAALYEWVVVVSPDCTPCSEEWLSGMAQHFNSEKYDMVLGYANYKDNGSAIARRAIFERMTYIFRCFHSAKKGKAIGGDCINFAIRKSTFLENKGFAESLTVPFGDIDLLVNALAVKGRTAVEAQPETTLLQELPEEVILQNERIQKIETLRHLNHRGQIYRLLNGAASCACIGYSLLAFASVCIVFGCNFVQTGYREEILIFCICTLVLWAMGIALSVGCLRRSTNFLEEKKYGSRVYTYELAQPFRGLTNKIRRWRLRHDFVRR